MYTGAISHEQDVEYNSSDISQADSSSSIVKAAQDFMQAKNEMDVQTQLYQKGMDNTLDQATQDANAAFETLQQAQTDSKVKLVDTDNIQTAEDQLLKMSNDDITAKVDVEADTSEAESDIENLQNVSGSTVTLNCDVSNEGSFEQAKSTIESMPSDTTATIDMEVNGEEDVEKATELIESAPTNGAKLVVDCEVNNKEEFDELMQAQSTANSKGANVEVHASIKGVDVDSAATADTEVPVKGKLEIEPYSGDAVEVNASDNLMMFYPDAGSMKRYSSAVHLPYAFGIKNRDFFGLQAFIKEYLITYFKRDFFKLSTDEVQELYTISMDIQLGEGNYDISPILKMDMPCLAQTFIRKMKNFKRLLVCVMQLLWY